MRVRSIGLFAAAIVLFAASAFAQEASIFGTITDATKRRAARASPSPRRRSRPAGCSPASATSAATIGCAACAPGRYKVQAELSGFATVIVPDVEVLVGQNRHGAVRDAGGDA